MGGLAGATIYGVGTALTAAEAADLKDDAESLRQQARSIFDNPASTPKEQASANAMISEADRLSSQSVQTLALPITKQDLERSPEEQELIEQMQSSRGERMERRSDRVRSNLNDELTNLNLIPQP